MRFFTPQLHRRCHSSDEAVLQAASEEWEQATERYEQHFQALAPQLPSHMREFADLLLHDARVELMAQAQGQFLMVLRQDIPPHSLVLLRYDLASKPTVEAHAENPGDWSKLTDFQFDELDRTVEGGRPVWTQAIVLGNGWLLQLRFVDVQTTLAQRVYPALIPGSLPAFPLPQSA